VTVTHPDVSRYFMTIPEASQLVLEAATLGSTGEILMLDMGKAVKIVDLAQDLIDLSGRRDLQIAFTGLKGGEKLTEDLLLEEETYDRTQHPTIVVGRMQPLEPLVFDRAIDRLRTLALRGDDQEVRRCLSAMISDATLELENDQPEAVPDVGRRAPRTA
jgi:FlaA1/EpsC-like NDP-sugar epimerase